MYMTNRLEGEQLDCECEVQLSKLLFLDALASLDSMMSVIVSLTENNWVTDRKFSLLQDVM